VNPCPAPPDRQPTDSPHTYSTALALYVLSHLEQYSTWTTAHLDDEQLESAARGLNYYLTQRAIIADEPTPERVYNQIDHTLDFVRTMQAGRARIAQEARAQLAAALGSTPPDSHPNGGKPVFPPAPSPRPITPQHQPQEVRF